MRASRCCACDRNDSASARCRKRLVGRRSGQELSGYCSVLLCRSHTCCDSSNPFRGRGVLLLWFGRMGPALLVYDVTRQSSENCFIATRSLALALYWTGQGARDAQGQGRRRPWPRRFPPSRYVVGPVGIHGDSYLSVHPLFSVALPSRPLPALCLVCGTEVVRPRFLSCAEGERNSDRRSCRNGTERASLSCQKTRYDCRL